MRCSIPAPHPVVSVISKYLSFIFRVDKPSVVEQLEQADSDMKRINSCSGLLEGFSVAAFLEEVSECSSTTTKVIP